MAQELEFSSFNAYANLGFFSAKSPEELQAQIVKWRGQLQVISIYFDGKQHIAWIRTNFPIKKKIKGA